MKMNAGRPGLLDSLAPIVGAVEILSAERFRFAGRPGAEPDPQAQPLPGQIWPQASVVFRLQMELYQHCYCRPFRGQPLPPEAAPEAVDLLPALTAANQTRDG